MKNILLILCFSITTSFAQTLLLEENFDYPIGDTLTNHGWVAHSGAGNNPILLSTGGLLYDFYPSSGIGNCIQLIGGSGSREDVNRTFNELTVGSIYISCLVQISDQTSTTEGDYILHLGSSSTTQFCRLWVRISESNVQFGISKYSEVPVFSTNNYLFNYTYLIVLKYTFESGLQDDVVNMWVFSSGIPSSEIEAGTPTIENITATNNDANSFSSVSLRQGDKTYRCLIDGIRVATEWSQAPLPIELNSFSAIKLKNSVKLVWQTETEVNNYGFEILRSTQNDDWNALGFVHGNGNSNSPKNYSFVDDKVSSGKYSYRLKQIDNDGQFEYSKTVEVDFGNPDNFSLRQNYPNPFNPVTTIEFILPEAGNSKLTVYNLLGQEIQTLVNEFKEPGIHTINFNAGDLQSGFYIYKLEAGGVVQTKKMLLIK